MLSELRPAGLVDAAKSLGVDPFELVRLAVASGSPPERLVFSADTIAALRAFGGLEDWWKDAGLPKDPSVRRARMRFLGRKLLEGGFVGDKATRLDNLWRGLGADDRAAIEQAVSGMLQEGVVRTVATVKGPMISVTPQGVAALQQFVQNGGGLQALQGLW